LETSGDGYAFAQRASSINTDKPVKLQSFDLTEMPRQAALTYDGTSWHRGGWQSLKTKNAVACGAAFERFRQHCTDAASPTMVRVDLQNTPQHGGAFEAAHQRLLQEFGEPVADFARRSGGTSNWFLTLPQLRSALSIVDALQPIPAGSLFGILSVTYKIEFRFLQRASRSPLPFQEQADYLNAEVEYNRFLGTSFLIAMFSNRHVVSSFFSFPFEDWNDDAAAYVRFVQAELPFRISERRWKRWHLNNAATSYVGRRVAVSWS
jgi:hypothetical protein